MVLRVALAARGFDRRGQGRTPEGGQVDAGGIITASFLISFQFAGSWAVLGKKRGTLARASG